MKAAKIDVNQPEIVDALRKAGASVESLARLGKKIPDLLVGFRGKNYLLEVKQPGKGLSEGQAEWAAVWRGQSEKVESIKEAFQAVGITKMSEL
jgi:hypothetical protein